MLSVFSLFQFTQASVASAEYNHSKSIDQPLRLVTPIWKNFTQADGSGFYFELMRLIYHPVNISVEYEIMPWARSLLILEQQQADAIVGSYLIDAEKFHFPDNPIWLDVSAVAFKTDKVDWQGVSSMKNKVVAWIRGYSYDDFIDINISTLELIDNKQAWEMLSLDRIDFYMDSITDLKIYLNSNNLSGNDYTIEKVLTKPMYIRFALTEKGKNLAEIYDKRLPDIVANGELKALYQKWGYYPDHYHAFLSALEEKVSEPN